MTKDDNIFFAKRKLTDSIYRSAILDGMAVTFADAYSFMNDGNKRVANLIANKEMIKSGQGIISVPVEKIGEYLEKLIKYYETNNMEN